MLEELFYRYNPWWEGEFTLKGIYKRETVYKKLSSHIKSRRIIFLTGLRRVGKTTLMKLLIKELIDKQIAKPQNIFYISLDDYLISGKNISEILDEYRKIQKKKFSDKIFVFFDEIAYKSDFEQQLKNIYDNQNVKLFASSSSTSVLKSKKHFLTGRNVIIEIYPLNFDEFLEFKNIKLNKSDGHLEETYFNDFLKIGGMPEYVLKGEIEYLKELVDDIINKDIVAFYNVKDPSVLKDFFFLLMERAGKNVSINKLANILKISPDTARRYLQMFEETYLIYLVPRSGKPNERIISPKKLYASDIGIRTYFTGFKDKGSLFENYIYFLIRDKNPKYVYENGIELDFFTHDKILIEVKYNSSLTPKQKELFDAFIARKKILIKSISDVKKYFKN